jgi:hypothetical protein
MQAAVLFLMRLLLSPLLSLRQSCRLSPFSRSAAALSSLIFISFLPAEPRFTSLIHTYSNSFLVSCRQAPLPFSHFLPLSLRHLRYSAFLFSPFRCRLLASLTFLTSLCRYFGLLCRYFAAACRCFADNLPGAFAEAGWLRLWLC